MTCDLFSAIDVQADESMNSQNGKCSARGRPLSQRPSIAFLVAVAVAVAGCTSEKDRLDAEAKRLCAIDGGIKVFETVTLPPEKFNQYGQPLIPNGRDDMGFGYFRRGQETHLAGPHDSAKGANLGRYTWEIVRTTDGKVMSQGVVYGRSGGCFLDGYIQGCGFQCPQLEAWVLEKNTFHKQETK